MNFTNALDKEFNYKLTENGGLAHKSTCDALYDMFALGGAYRSRSDEDCVFLFMKAFEENPTYAMKCLFYLRDILQGQGERRFFRVCIKWAADNHSLEMERNLKYIPEYGRWDDLYAFVGTALEKSMWAFMYEQFRLDMASKTPSLLGKWLKSENTSSKESRALGTKTRKALGMTAPIYRKSLSSLRKRINVLERLMSERRWDEIEFDKIPSKAGLIYKNAFARHDVERARNKAVQTYEQFAKDKNTKVNTKALYPYEVVEKAIDVFGGSYYRWSRHEVPLDDTNRLMVNKYWENLAEYISKLDMNALCVVDTSGSMHGTPIDIAISLGMIAADKAHGPFHGRYISFSSRPQLIKVEGVDFVDKVRRIYETNLCENTNLEATFDMLLNVAQKNHMKQKDLPDTIIVISDMEIDCAYGSYGYYSDHSAARAKNRTMMENMRRKWARAGYKLPKMVYWNVDARQDTFLDDGPDVTYVSGASAILFEQVAKGITAQDLMFEKLDSERYAKIK